MALTQPPAVLSAGRGAPRREPPARAYACPLPLVPARARGLTVETADGRRYLDCFPGGGALVLGHHHPVVREAVRSALARGVPPAEVFADELRATLPGRLADRAHLSFCPPTRAAALAAARALAEGAGRFVELVPGGDGADGSGGPTAVGAAVGALEDPDGGGFPGALDLAAGRTVTGRPGPAPGGDGRAAAVRVTACRPGAGPGGGGDHPARDAAAATALVGGSGSRVRAVPGGGGGDGTPPRDVTATRAQARGRALLVADETRTGLGRTGAFWAVEHTGRAPDAMILAGAIGGGLPLALVVHGDDMPAALPDRDAHGNRPAMAAGAATLRYVRENGLAARAAALGARMLTRLRRAVADRDPVTGVHGRGLLLGVTCADATAAEAVRRACLRRGLLVGTDDDPRLLCLLPPLTLTDEQAEAVLDRLTDAVGAVSGGSRAGGPVAPRPAARPRAVGAVTGGERTASAEAGSSPGSEPAAGGAARPVPPVSPWKPATPRKEAGAPPA
ncbi:aminotransferase class III-fold pyridoxal phosphate-dependent enzyme [Streptomyces mobaraensis]|uniref:Diaminobutyrate--2-oxoglutarate transaminase n=1 Tax=Streptomyces mobaraensis TaxID=35621 RepID=A0A5N5W748_STRMB|nr:aminotransferase class III-fold pyridoxal phosphate-dependent enzyme [Streptomyces mobaraensis]KAB7844359.1 aminotransferase class III-fold pyridoxal phosphate-dependent enzyme [Streptomyces mobaraensis]